MLIVNYLFQVARSKTLRISHALNSTMATPEQYVACRQRVLETVGEHLARGQPDTTTDKLTGFMASHYFHVKSKKQFQELEDNFAWAVTEYKVVSFDTESRRLSQDLWGGLESYLIGTFDGSVYDFSVPDLKKEAEQDGSLVAGDLTTVLPYPVVDVLENKRILKIGSDAGADSVQDEELGISTGPVICSQILHQLANEISPSKDYATGHGLGRVADDLYGVTHKHNTKHSDQPEAWRKHANFRLYDWVKPLKSFAFVYRALDATLPLCLISWIIRSFVVEHLVSKELVCGPFYRLLRAITRPALAKGGGFWTKGTARNPSQWKACTVRKGTGNLRDSVKSSDPEETRETRQGEDEKISGTSSGQPEDGHELYAVEVVEISSDDEEGEMLVDAIGEVEVLDENKKEVQLTFKTTVHPNDVDLTGRDLELAREELEDGRRILTLNRKKKLPESARRPSGYTRTPSGSIKKKMRRRDQKSRFKCLNPGMRANNKYRFKPVLHRWCTYCGKTTHSKRDEEGNLLCPAFRRQLKSLVKQEPEDECMYKLCSNRIGHRTAVCPTMAQRCPECWLRGHQREQHCSEVEAQESFKRMFEEHADWHPLLSLRHEDPQWGFYYIKREKKCTVKYDELIKMSVAEAMKLIERM